MPSGKGDDEERVRRLTTAAKLSAFVRGGREATPHDGWVAVLVGVVAGFVIGYLCRGLFG
jgi:hypothetical protein